MKQSILYLSTVFFLLSGNISAQVNPYEEEIDKLFIDDVHELLFNDYTKYKGIFSKLDGTDSVFYTNHMLHGFEPTITIGGGDAIFFGTPKQSPRPPDYNIIINKLTQWLTPVGFKINNSDIDAKLKAKADQLGVTKVILFYHMNIEQTFASESITLYMFPDGKYSVGINNEIYKKAKLNANTYAAPGVRNGSEFKTLVPFHTPDYLYGYKDDKDKVVVSAIYYSAEDFSEGLALYCEKVYHCGYLDLRGMNVIAADYRHGEDFGEGLAAVENDGEKWGFIDKTGKEVIPFKYNKAAKFSEGLCPVMKGKKWGYIDKTGKEVIPFKYERAWEFSDGAASVRDDHDSKFYYIDKTGAVTTAPKPKDIETPAKAETNTVAKTLTIVEQLTMPYVNNQVSYKINPLWQPKDNENIYFYLSPDAENDKALSQTFPLYDQQLRVINFFSYAGKGTEPGNIENIKQNIIKGMINEMKPIGANTEITDQQYLSDLGFSEEKYSTAKGIDGSLFYADYTGGAGFGQFQCSFYFADAKNIYSFVTVRFVGYHLNLPEKAEGYKGDFTYNDAERKAYLDFSKSIFNTIEKSK